MHLITIEIGGGVTGAMVSERGQVYTAKKMKGSPYSLWRPATPPNMTIAPSLFLFTILRFQNCVEHNDKIAP